MLKAITISYGVAILFLLLFQDHGNGGGADPHTCSGAQASDFPAPKPASCPPGETASASCLHSCIMNYKIEMVELAEIACQFRKDLNKQFEMDAFLTCMPDYYDCYDKCYPDLQSCVTICNECRSDLWATDYAPQLAAFESTLQEFQGYVAMDFASCSQGCCN